MPLKANSISVLLARGMLCGILAGICAFLFGHQIGEPQIDKAIAFEDHMRTMAGMAPDAEIFSRSVQSGLGLFTAIVAIGTALGGLFAIGCAFARGRLGALPMRAISALVAAAGFLSVVLIPSLKYPANPPSIGIPETIGLRTVLFFSSIGISLCLLVLAMLIVRTLIARWGTWNACITGLLAYLIAVTIAQLFLPDINEVPAGFPAVVLWKFRIASLETQAVLWATIGLVFGAWCEREEAR